MKTLFNREITVYQRDARTNLCFDLAVEQDFEALEFLCGFTPTHLDSPDLCRPVIEELLSQYIPTELTDHGPCWQQFVPLPNHITLSLDCAGTYIGCAHRLNAPRHLIAEHLASPGFIQTKITAASWRMVLNVHALVTEQAVYSLRVNALEKGDALYV